MSSETRLRALRGATTVDGDDPGAIREHTRELLAALMASNDVETASIVSAIFTVTRDLESEFPARAARDLGWTDVPLLCVHEMSVPGALPRCIRVLLHVESERPREAMRHVYLRGAIVLRPDLLGE